MSYRDRNRKSITLPSGATCAVRKLIVNDFISIGDIPGSADNAGKTKARKLNQKEQEDAIKWGAAVQRAILTKCLSKINFEDKSFTVVDKPFGEASENEIEIDALDQVDAEFIVNEVMAMSGMRKEAGSSAQTFQPETSGHTEPAQVGEAIPCSPEPPVSVTA